MENEKRFLEECRQRIETKVGWGPGSAWQNQDFEALSDRIFKETKVSLSVSTLKRVWGKVRYEGTPNIATLNALAQFAGYENWRAFTSNGSVPLANIESPPKEKVKSTRSYVPWSIVAIVAIAIAAFLFWQMGNRSKKLKYENIVFTSEPVVNTVPNTVVFHYNAKDSNADSVFIQQSWDPMRRYKVDKELTNYTSTYYQPGYFRAKLILDTTVVAEQDIFIESNGWLGTVDREHIPIYASEKEILQDSIVRFNDEFFTAQKIDLEKEKLTTSFFRVVKEEALPDTAFQMDITLKNTLGTGGLICQKTYIIVMGTMGMIGIPLSIKGCVGELGLVAGEYRDGKTNDLSAFGVDFSDWVTVQCRVQNKKISILVNDAKAFEGEYKNSIGGVVGSRIMFMGKGEVKRFGLRKI